MPTIKFNERAVAKLLAPDPSGRQTIHWDADLKGFGLLCSGVAGTKTYIVQRRLKNGRTRRLTIGPANVFKLDRARELAEAQLGEMYQGIDPKAAKPKSATLQAALDNFLTSRRDLRPKSQDSYRKGIETYLAEWLSLLVKDITPDVVEKRHTAIAAEIAARYKKPLEKIGPQDGDTSIRRTGFATANGTMRAFRAIWNFASDRDSSMASLQNPVRRLRQSWFSVPSRTRRLTSEQLPKFYGAVNVLPNRTARAYLLLLLFTGLRREECASLCWADIDLMARTVHLPAARTKAGRALTLPMSDYVHALLVAHRALGRDGDFVFASSGKKKQYLSSPKFAFRQVEQATKIHISPHDLRRTYIGVAESLDISAYALKALVNHAPGRDVTSGYLNISVERLRDPAQRVADRLKQLCGIVPPSGKTIKRFPMAHTKKAFVRRA